MYIVERLDWTLSESHMCEWCGKKKPVRQLRYSLRLDPVPRVILYCLSCRAREAAGQLDSHGRRLGHENFAGHNA